MKDSLRGQLLRALVAWGMTHAVWRRSTTAGPYFAYVSAATPRDSDDEVVLIDEVNLRNGELNWATRTALDIGGRGLYEHVCESWAKRRIQAFADAGKPPTHHEHVFDDPGIVESKVFDFAGMYPLMARQYDPSADTAQAPLVIDCDSVTTSITLVELKTCLLEILWLDQLKVHPSYVNWRVRRQNEEWTRFRVAFRWQDHWQLARMTPRYMRSSILPDTLRVPLKVLLDHGLKGATLIRLQNRGDHVLVETVEDLVCLADSDYVEVSSIGPKTLANARAAQCAFLDSLGFDGSMMM